MLGVTRPAEIPQSTVSLSPCSAFCCVSTQIHRFTRFFGWAGYNVVYGHYDRGRRLTLRLRFDRKKWDIRYSSKNTVPALAVPYFRRDDAPAATTMSAATLSLPSFLPSFLPSLLPFLPSFLPSFLSFFLFFFFFFLSFVLSFFFVCTCNSYYDFSSVHVLRF